MKLSEIKGERVFDVIADIIEPVAKIAADDDAMVLFDASDRPDDVEPWQYFVQRATKAVPVLMRRHRDELCEIMASLNDTTKDEYLSEVTVPKLFADVLDLVTDSEFMSFFS